MFMCAVYCKTCQLWTKHLRKDEDDISQIVKRTLGRCWYLILGVSSALFLMLLCIIYFLLLNRALFPVIRLLLGMELLIVVSLGVSEDIIQSDTKGISFNRISIQYLGVLTGLCLLPLFNVSSKEKILKFVRYGTIPLVLYFAMLLVMFGISVSQGHVNP